MCVFLFTKLFNNEFLIHSVKSLRFERACNHCAGRGLWIKAPRRATYRPADTTVYRGQRCLYGKNGLVSIQ